MHIYLDERRLGEGAEIFSKATAPGALIGAATSRAPEEATPPKTLVMLSIPTSVKGA